MRITGKLNLQGIKDFSIAFGIAVFFALLVYGFFALLSLMSWILSWILIAVILTPIIYWIMRYAEDDITIDYIETKDKIIIDNKIISYDDEIVDRHNHY